MIVEHAAFFELDEEVTMQSISTMVFFFIIQLSDPLSAPYIKLFKNLHKFYINDIIFQKYD